MDRCQAVPLLVEAWLLNANIGYTGAALAYGLAFRRRRVPPGRRVA